MLLIKFEITIVYIVHLAPLITTAEQPEHAM